MKNRHVALRTLLLAVFACAFASLAQAQAIRTWVSSTGDDANPCSTTAPCKTFAGAIAKTSALGELSVADASGYGSVTITKSITINGTGSLAGNINAYANGISVIAASTDVVVLRNISINGMHTSLDGIRVVSAKTVQVDHCWIHSQGSHGIEVAATDNVNLNVNDTIIEDCTLDGIHVSTTGGLAVVEVDNCRIQDSSSDGIEAVSNIRATVRNSFLAHNASAGLQTTGSNTEVNLIHSTVTNSSVGLQASAGASVRVSDSAITQNLTGLNANGGAIDSFQGNSLMGNITAGTFTTTTLKQ